MSVIRYLYKLLLGVWLGSLLFFSAVVAPLVFSALGPTPPAIGVIQDIVAVLDRATIAAGAALALLAFAYEGAPRRAGWLRAGLFGAAMALAAVSHWALDPQLRAVHERAGGSAAALPKDHPTHREFDQIHRATAAMMGVEILLGLVAVGLRLRPKASSAVAVAAPRAVSPS